MSTVAMPLIPVIAIEKQNACACSRPIEGKGGSSRDRPRSCGRSNRVRRRERLPLRLLPQEWGHTTYGRHEYDVIGKSLACLATRAAHAAHAEKPSANDDDLQWG